MNVPIVLAIVTSVVVGGLVALVVAFAIGRSIVRRTSQIPSTLDGGSYPCYRCGVEATTDYMGLRYCGMCRMVVARMIAVVRDDPPFGFPGSSGYLEFPEKGPPVEEKKEA